MGSLLSLLHCKGQRKNIKYLQFDGNGEYTFQFVSGVHSSLKTKKQTKKKFHISKAKETLDVVVFALKEKIRMSGLSRFRYFVATLFSLAGDDRVQKWPESSQLQ